MYIVYTDYNKQISQSIIKYPAFMYNYIYTN